MTITIRVGERVRVRNADGSFRPAARVLAFRQSPANRWYAVLSDGRLAFVATLTKENPNA